LKKIKKTSICFVSSAGAAFECSEKSVVKTAEELEGVKEEKECAEVQRLNFK